LTGIGSGLPGIELSLRADSLVGEVGHQADVAVEVGACEVACRAVAVAVEHLRAALLRRGQVAADLVV
jgi:hypothetical protein